MADVISLRPTELPAEPRVWVCGHCGSQHFMLFEDGSTECALCDFVDAEQRGGWARQVKPDPDFDENMPTRLVTPHGTADFVRASVLKSVDDSTVAVVVLWPNGKIKTWSSLSKHDSPERQAWLREALQCAADLALGAPPTDLDRVPE